MKLTLLDMVQRTLSAMDSNNVTTVNDSVEAEQVVLIVQRILDDINSRRDWTWLYKEDKLLATVTPNEMLLPDDCLNVMTIRYKGKVIEYMYPQDFRDMLFKRSGDNVVDGYYTDRFPRYYTSLAPNRVVFDATDPDWNNLLPSLSYIYYIKNNDVLWNDNDVPDIPYQFHPVILHGVIGTALLELKGDVQASQFHLSEYKKGIIKMLRWSRVFNDRQPRTDSKIDYGRRGTQYADS